MSITASAVKELRQRTGAGMMDCKKALVEVDGDMDEAIKLLRAKSLAAADKKAHRDASEGQVVIAVDGTRAAILELNCETDFVARNDDFSAFATELVNQALSDGVCDIDVFLTKQWAGDAEHTVEQALSQKVSTIGENIKISRIALVEAADGNGVGSYVHMGGKIGVVVEVTASAGDEALRDVAMHVAAANPDFLHRDQVTQQAIDTERDVAMQQAIAAGKPEHIAEKMVSGKLKKFYVNNVLLEQAFAKDSSMSVGDFVTSKGGEQATVAGFVRFELGSAG